MHLACCLTTTTACQLPPRAKRALVMETMYAIFLTITISIFISFFFKAKSQNQQKLPPGPTSLPLIGNLFLLNKSLLDVTPKLKQLWSRHGPVVAIPIAGRPVVFISDPAVVHEALVQKGAAFADRPQPSKTMLLLSSNRHNISNAGYGPLWRLLRRNIASEVFHPSRIRYFAPARKTVLASLLKKLHKEAESSMEVDFIENFRFAMFSSLVLMCFGEALEEDAIMKIMDVERRLHVGAVSEDSFALLPMIGKIKSFFGNNHSELIKDVMRTQREIYIPLIRRRKQCMNVKEKKKENGNSFDFSHVDSLLALELHHDNNRKLSEDEIVSNCSEFLNAGMDATTSVLQWVMANLVKHPAIQSKLAREIEQVAKRGEEESVEEEDLEGMVYLKAVVLEALRRHPPGHFLLPHAVSEDVELGGYVLPRGTVVNVEVRSMAVDGKVWEEPMEFRPERFAAGGERPEVDLTGSREMRMLPFGGGRRICPGMATGILHLEYFVANLVREFEWSTAGGGEVDLAEKQEFTVVLKNPLKVTLVPRKKV